MDYRARFESEKRLKGLSRVRIPPFPLSRLKRMKMDKILKLIDEFEKAVDTNANEQSCGYVPADIRAAAEAKNRTKENLIRAIAELKDKG